ncbi:MAG: aspartate aminotransferase [Candidatus Marinimicrobia bacterium]|nr:aspartate aminotransferase [Candidatus Neomarinimicrobiota bacterium]RPG04825.1 MAG: aminotransferase class I/II-fold pyridoxal phosphate-dependent enzyme [Pelagibacteraceae bacterium TMED247]|tara:strand:+ start:77 stop:1312 length:1236 start_codon:yes stop_codon:yes gene_type:complete
MSDYTKKNIKSLKPSATLAINEKSKELISKGKKVYKFGFGQSPFPVPESVVLSLKKNAHKKEYMPIQGSLELREAIAKYINKRTNNSFSSENIIISPGSKEMMFLLHLGFDGDIILPAPSWVSYEPHAIIANNKFHWLETTNENNWFPTSEQLEKKAKELKNKNSILILNSPNNPSGSNCENFEEIAKVAKKYGIIVLSDEIYTELTFNREYKSISKFYPEGTIISSGLSKWCGAGGWRLGFFAVPRKLDPILKMLKTLSSESFTAVSSPIQIAAIEAFNGNHSDYLNKTTSILNAVGNYVYENLKSNKVLMQKPEGGFYLMPEFLNSKFKTSSEMCTDILNKSGVALLPGSDFGFKPSKMLARLSYTDFNGEVFLKNTKSGKKPDEDDIKKFAPNIVEGTKRLVDWSKSL